jgi:hypothetical protein
VAPPVPPPMRTAASIRTVVIPRTAEPLLLRALFDGRHAVNALVPAWIAQPHASRFEAQAILSPPSRPVSSPRLRLVGHGLQRHVGRPHRLGPRPAPGPTPRPRTLGADAGAAAPTPTPQGEPPPRSLPLGGEASPAHSSRRPSSRPPRRGAPVVLEIRCRLPLVLRPHRHRHRPPLPLPPSRRGPGLSRGRDGGRGPQLRSRSLCHVRRSGRRRRPDARAEDPGTQGPEAAVAAQAFHWVDVPKAMAEIAVPYQCELYASRPVRESN